MRYLFGFMCALALSVTGCSETTGTGGSGGTAGDGGSGGDGGTGGMPECQGPEDCDDGEDCTTDTCADAMCEYTALQDGTECLIRGEFFAGPGLCAAGSCVPDCEVLEEGSACGVGDRGVCVDGLCQPRCESDADCTDYKDCTTDSCLSNGLCQSVAVQDGTLCAGGTCQSGECALESTLLPCTEQGIRNAIAAGGEDPYTFHCAGATTVITSAVILIHNDVILDGESELSVDGGADHDVFLVTEGTTAQLRGFAVTNGAGEGGGILNRGNLTVEASTVSGNICDLCNGGGIRNEGTLMLVSSTVSGNSGDDGAGIFNDNLATATVRNCTVSNNIGSGLSNHRGTLTVTNTTVSGNTGSGILNLGSRPGTGFAVATVTNSTVSGNTGGGLHNDEGTLTVTNTTVSDNTGGDGGISTGPGGGLTLENTIVDDDCFDESIIVSNGYNIESPGDTCGFDQTGDQSGVSAVLLDLQPLANNGGQTQTHAITTDSAAFNAGTCEVDEDQRGVTRPQGPACDVGAFELEQ